MPATSKENSLKQLRKRLTYANVMSSIAVFLVLGGAAVAATQLPKNSVGPKQLKKGAVTTAKIKKGAVTNAKVKPGSLKASAFAAGQLPAGPKGETGPVGPTFGTTAEGGCGEPPTNFAVCLSTGSVNLPAAGRVLLIASGEWDNDNDTAPNSGACRLSVDGSSIEPTVDFGEDTTTHTISDAGSLSLNTVTGHLPAGNHTFALECETNEPEVFIDEAMLSAVLLGS
jgi:hypothetical protein